MDLLEYFYYTKNGFEKIHWRVFLLIINGILFKIESGFLHILSGINYLDILPVHQAMLKVDLNLFLGHPWSLSSPRCHGLSYRLDLLVLRML